MFDRSLGFYVLGNVILRRDRIALVGLSIIANLWAEKVNGQPSTAIVCNLDCCAVPNQDGPSESAKWSRSDSNFRAARMAEASSW